MSPVVHAVAPGHNGAIVYNSTQDGALDVEIYAANPDGSNPVRLSLTPGQDRAPVWSPDGTKIAFFAMERNTNLADIYIMNADGSNQVRVSPGGVSQFAPSFSPDGGKLAYYSTVSGNTDIYTVHVDGTNVQRLTTVAQGDFWPTWSPDGTKLAFYSLRDGATNSEIYIMNADGSGQTRLTNTVAGVHDQYPDFSPDGTKLVFASNREGDYQLYTMDSNGTNVQALPALPHTSTTNPPVARWSPDGTKIVFSTVVGANPAGPLYRIYTMQSDGSNITPITPDSRYNYTYPSWQPSAQPYVPTVPTPRPQVLTFTSLGANPSAAAQPSALGKRISDLLAYDNKLYPAYGDSVDNHGPVQVDLYDLATRSYTGDLLSVPTEAFSPFRAINGTVYGLTFDPLGGDPAGYASSNDSVTWTLATPFTARHLLDIQPYKGNLFISGAEGTAGVVFRSNDGGSSWATSLSQTSPYSTNVRFNWLLPFRDALYAQTSAPQSPVKIFDGSSWTDGTTSLITYTGERPVVFADRIVGKLNGLSAFDGTSVSKVASFSGWARDTYVDDGYLYVLRGNDNSIVRTNNLITWEELGSAPAGAYSLAVYNDRVYIGGEGAVLSESNTISDALASQDGGQGEQPTLTPTGVVLYMLLTTAFILLTVAVIIRIVPSSVS
ncbi:MAG: hypothetical protein WBP26_02495 [Candidatus Saccharimonadales bacterium]